jgi:hypothetical protein
MMTRLLAMGKAMLLVAVTAVLGTMSESTKLLTPLLPWRMSWKMEPEPPTNLRCECGVLY